MKIKKLSQSISFFLLENINEKQKLIKNTFWILLAKIGGTLFRGLSFILSARFLGPQLYGIFSSVYSYVSIYQSFGDFGLTTVLTKKVSEDQKHKEVYLINTIFIFTLLALGLFIVSWQLSSIFLKGDLSQKIFIFIFGALFFDLLRELGNSFLRGLEKMEIQSLIHNLINFLSFLSILVILKQKPLVEILAQIYFWSFLIGAILIFIFIRKNLDVFHYKLINLKDIKNILNESWSLGLANVLFFLNFNLTILILNLFASSQIVGLYSSSLRFYEALLFLTSSFNLAIFPLMSKNKIYLEKYLNLSFRFSHLVFWPLLIGSFILGKDALVLLFGVKYVSAYPYFIILMLGYLFNSFLLTLINLLIVLQKRKELLIFDFLNLLIIILVSFLLIPFFQGYGAALTHLLNFTLIFIFAYFVGKKYASFNLFQDWLKFPLASFLMGGILFLSELINLHLIIKIFLGVLVYLVILFILKEKFVLELKMLRNN